MENEEKIVRDSAMLVEEQVSREEQQRTPINEWVLPFNSQLAKLMRQKFAYEIQNTFYNKGEFGYYVKLAMKPKQLQAWIEGKVKFSTSQVYQFTYNGRQHKGHFVATNNNQKVIA